MEVVGELGGEALLELGLTREVMEGPGEGAEAGDAVDRTVRHPARPVKGQEVMGAQAVEGKIAEDDEVAARGVEGVERRRRALRRKGTKDVGEARGGVRPLGVGAVAEGVEHRGDVVFEGHPGLGNQPRRASIWARFSEEAPMSVDTGPAARHLHSALTALQQGKPDEARAEGLAALEGFSVGADRTGAAAAHQVLAMVGIFTGRLDQGLLHVDAAIPLREATGDAEGVASLWQERLEIALRLGDIALAVESGRGQVAALADSPDREARAHAAHQLAQVLLQSGVDGEAEALAQGALFELGDVGTERARSALFLLLASIHLHRGAPERALGVARQALDLSRQAKNRSAEIDALQHLGVVHHALGDHTMARRVLEEALVGRELMKDDAGKAVLLRELAQVELALGLASDAWGRFRYAVRTLRESGDVPGEVATLQVFQEIASNAGDGEVSAEACRLLLDAAERTGDDEAVAAASFVLATRLAAVSDLAGAVRQFERARDLQAAAGLSVESAMSAGMLGQCVFVLGRHDEGLALVRGSLSVLQSSGAPAVAIVQEILKELESIAEIASREV